MGQKLNKIILSLVLYIFIPTDVWADIECRGRILDGKTVEPLIGATVIVKGSKNGTATDLSGSFKLIVPERSKLWINYPDFESVVLSAKRDMGTILLQKGSSKLPSQKQIDSWVEKGIGYYDKEKYDKAFDLFEKAARVGSTEGIFHLGLCWLYGHGIQMDKSEGARLIREAAEDGYVEAQYMLGGLYRNGEGVTKKIGEAKYWFWKASEQGSERAKAALYDMGSEF